MSAVTHGVTVNDGASIRDAVERVDSRVESLDSSHESTAQVGEKDQLLRHVFGGSGDVVGAVVGCEFCRGIIQAHRESLRGGSDVVSNTHSSSSRVPAQPLVTSDAVDGTLEDAPAPVNSRTGSGAPSVSSPLPSSDGGDSYPAASSAAEEAS